MDPTLILNLIHPNTHHNFASQLLSLYILNVILPTTPGVFNTVSFLSNYTGQQISKKYFVSVMNMVLIYLFASMKLEKGHKKNYLALVLKLCYTTIFYEIG